MKDQSILEHVSETLTELANQLAEGRKLNQRTLAAKLLGLGGLVNQFHHELIGALRYQVRPPLRAPVDTISDSGSAVNANRRS